MRATGTIRSYFAIRFCFSRIRVNFLCCIACRFCRRRIRCFRRIGRGVIGQNFRVCLRVRRFRSGFSDCRVSLFGGVHLCRRGSCARFFARGKQDAAENAAFPERFHGNPTSVAEDPVAVCFVPNGVGNWIYLGSASIQSANFCVPASSMR